jgi:hypothetical protein
VRGGLGGLFPDARRRPTAKARPSAADDVRCQRKIVTAVTIGDFVDSE